MSGAADGFVIDCSIAMAWCLGEASLETDFLLGSLRSSQGRVPALWHFELGNVLLQAERRKRIVAADTAAIWSFIDALPIVTDAEPPERRRRDVWTLARRHGLTVYDAAYLELAVRVGLPLATRDADLLRAAGECGVAVLPKRSKPG